MRERVVRCLTHDQNRKLRYSSPSDRTPCLRNSSHVAAKPRSSRLAAFKLLTRRKTGSKDGETATMCGWNTGIQPAAVWQTAWSHCFLCWSAPSWWRVPSSSSLTRQPTRTGLAGWLSLSSSSRWCSCTALHCPRRGGGRRDGLDWWPAKGPRRSPGPGPPRTLPARSSPRLSSAPAQDVIEGPATDSTPGLDPRARPHGDPDPFGRCGHLDHLSDHRDASLARMSRH